MKTTTTLKAVMAIAFAAFTMTANAETKDYTKRVKASNIKMETRHDDRDNRNYNSNWRNCQHNRLDRYNKKIYCHTCGVEMVKKEKNKDVYYNVVTPTAKNNKNYGGRDNKKVDNKKADNKKVDNNKADNKMGNGDKKNRR